MAFADRFFVFFPSPRWTCADACCQGDGNNKEARAKRAVVSVVLFDQNLDQKLDLGWPGSSPGLAQVKPWAGPESSPWENCSNFPKGFPKIPPVKKTFVRKKHLLEKTLLEQKTFWKTHLLRASTAAGHGVSWPAKAIQIWPRPVLGGHS